MMDEYSQADYDMYVDHSGYGSYMEEVEPSRESGIYRNDPEFAFAPLVINANDSSDHDHDHGYDDDKYRYQNRRKTQRKVPRQQQHQQHRYRIRRDAFGMERHVQSNSDVYEEEEEEEEEEYYNSNNHSHRQQQQQQQRRMKRFNLNSGSSNRVPNRFGYEPPSLKHDFQRKEIQDTGAGLFPPGQNPFKRPTKKLKPQRMSKGKEEEMEAEGPRLKSTTIGDSVIPIEKREKSSLVVPFGIHSAATVILQSAGQMQLSPSVQDELQFLLDCDDQSLDVDPWIEISDTIFNSHCKVYVREAVRLSQLLLAQALGCKYSVNFTATERSKPRTYKDDVIVMPFEGAEDQELNRSQDFGCEGAIRAALITQDLDENTIAEEMQAYMMVVGDISSSKACDHEFLEKLLKEVGSIVAGTKSYLVSDANQ